MSPQFHLASRSPRRAQLLRDCGLAFAVLDVDVVERPQPGQSPADYARSIARAKAQAGVARLATPGSDETRPVLAADTDVSLDGRILGKPRDRDEAVAMLLSLSERTHEVHSAVALAVDAEIEWVHSVSRVSFGRVTADEAAAYWATGEPADKAGAYAIQGLAARWVRRIEGSFTGIVGLPLYETLELMARHGIHAPLRRAPAEAGA